ncbi:hypothetical protein M406DRAFT_328859 [Cryphonectria parasitica EP155]|uniref:Uncharacterized protein n=1 Tax=Cryphonectria parasitica (strain ATCC 38755 / EP155) TaxID=660469 RepID=A0A9P4Y7D6_CRYP1|nr:uncharacterized protein M406DRAFT_328859 [Cryphonectria parasitica EP155]KAF3767804.1 hypothetical protein M406DRAFT_328859 [Cryphonectria parasitica EP155]
MTSRVEAPADGREDKARGVGRRLLSRMRTVLKRTETSKRQSTRPLVEGSHPAPSTSGATPSTEPTAPATTRQSPQATKETTLHHADKPLSKFQGEKVPRVQIYGDRIQQFSERCGLEVDPNAWYHMEGHVLRINRPVRMRVHRQCHQCGGDVGAKGLCGKCNHSFCHQCTRYPPKRSEDEKVASREKKAYIVKDREVNAMIVPDWDADTRKKTVVLRRSPPSGQQELVHKKVRQRVRRVCCQCQDDNGAEVLFHGGQRQCPKCDHVRCTDCPRDPPKKDKYPYGYPGDEFGVKSIPHHSCHVCRTKFEPGVENGTPCAACSHEKCDKCDRLMPQKVEPEPDAEVLRRVQAKLETLSLH